MFADIRTFMDLHGLQMLPLSGPTLVNAEGPYTGGQLSAGSSCTVIDGAHNHTGLHTYQYYDTCPYDLSK